ncbi:MAG: imidazole glycerol phosphate synthase subunit HisF [Clostridia bacterium]|nr:imidazole glycerol phosphate synthase subunit HisF [Clostridia bacterium]
MLKKRIIPCLDVRNGQVVKGVQFEGIKEIASPVALGKKYSEEGADELVFYDITASKEDRQIFEDFVKEVAREINIPFCVGGGIKSIEDFSTVLKCGADKVSINSAAVKNPELIKEASEKFGAQCVVLSVDCKKVGESKWEVFVRGGSEGTGLDVLEWIEKGVELGAGEIVVNSIDSDGMKHGYDLELLSAIRSRVSVPIIASGGAGCLEDFYDAAAVSDVDGILAASVFHYGEISIKELKSYLVERGIPMRL